MIEPADGAITHLSHPHCAWEGEAEDSPAHFGSYAIEIAADAEFTRVVDSDTLSSVVQRYVPCRPLAPGRYWWRVRRFDAQSAPLSQSAAHSFHIREPEELFAVPAAAGMAEIQAVLKRAAACASAKVVFEKGVYDLSAEKSAVFLALAGVTNLVVEGSGSRIIMDAGSRYVTIERCAHIEIRNFEFDMEPLPYSAGSVTSVDIKRGTFDLVTADGHPLPDSDKAFQNDRNGLVYDAGEIRMKRDVALVFRHAGWERLEGRHYRFKAESPKQLNEIAVGDIYIIDPRRGVAFENRYSDAVVFNTLSVYAAGNIGFSSHYANRFSIVNCRLARRKGRYLTGNNGGHNHHNARIGPWIEGCLFENTGDDVCHVNSLAVTAESQPAPDTVRLFLANPHDYGAPVQLDFRTGDALWFYNRNQGRVIARCRIESIAHAGGKFLDVKVDRAVDALVCGRHVAERDQRRGRDGSSEATQIFNMSRSCSQFVFRNNRVVAGRRIGVLAKGSGGLIENNVFEGLGGGAVELWNAPYEGAGAVNYVIRGNTIEGCCRIRRLDAPIWIQAFKSGGDRLHRNILIENNTVDGYDECAMLIRDADAVTVRRNILKNGLPGSRAVRWENAGVTSDATP